MYKSTYFINDKGRIIENGKRFCTSLYEEFFSVLNKYKNENNGKYPTERWLANECRVSTKTARKVISISKNKQTIQEKRYSKNGGTTNYGSRSLNLNEEMFLLSQYFENPYLTLTQYCQLLELYYGKFVSRSTICYWFKYSLPYKSSMRKTSVFPHLKYSISNLNKLKQYICTIREIDPKKIIYTDEKPVRGSDIYNRYVRRCPITGRTPFIKTKFKLRNTYNLMAAIRLNEPTGRNCFYKLGRFSGTSLSFLAYILEMVRSGFMTPGDVLVLDNARIHSTDYCEYLSDTLWTMVHVRVIYLPAYSPELNPIELCFNYFSQILKYTDIRYVANHSDEMFLMLCSRVLDGISNFEIAKMYKKVGINI